MKIFFTAIFLIITGIHGQDNKAGSANKLFDPELPYNKYTPSRTDRVISRTKYLDQLQGFWLAQCIANWTGLITEMDKIEPPFYTDDNWGDADQRNIWGNFVPHADTIDFYFIHENQPWGADDDTDIEYMYQHLLDIHNVSILSPEQISKGWLEHIYSNEDAPNGENFLWVSNETAYYLMKGGLMGFLLGKEGVGQAFDKPNLSDTYWISRTRRNLPDHILAVEGEDTFAQMAERGVYIIDRVVMEKMGGGVDLKKDVWYIPDNGGIY